MLVLSAQYPVFLLHTKILCTQPYTCFYAAYHSQKDKLPLSKVSRTQLKCFRGLEIIFAASSHLTGDSEIPASSPASSIFAFQHGSRSGPSRSPVCPSPTNLPTLILKSPALPISAASPGRGVPGAGGEAALAFSLPAPSLHWEMGNGGSQLTSKVPAFDGVPGAPSPQLKDACF